MKNFYLVIRPSLLPPLPKYYYVFAKDEIEARFKVEFKWGEYDDKTIVRKINENELDKLIISTNFYG